MSAYAKLARETAVEPDLTKAFARSAALLVVVLTGRARGMWDPATGGWVTKDDRCVTGGGVRRPRPPE